MIHVSRPGFPMRCNCGEETPTPTIINDTVWCPACLWALALLALGGLQSKTMELPQQTEEVDTSMAALIPD